MCAGLHGQLVWDATLKVFITCSKIRFYLYQAGHGHEIVDIQTIQGLDNPQLAELLGDQLNNLLESLELVQVQVILLI